MQFDRLGPYKIGKRLGRGGMGAVFEGLNVETGEQAAIKVLNPHLADDQGFRERFEIEIETLKKLKHPNIVRMYGYGEQEGYLYYAMELVPGSSVEDELQRGRKFSWREVVQGATKLCKALKHAHDHGVIHRDLKPGNLLLAPDGDIKLTDFGIARLFGNTRLTMEGGLVGTAEYMSPEQAAGDRITPHSDLYSLGSVMFAMLAGRPPFRAKALAEMLHKQRFEPPPPVSRFAMGVPPELEEVVTRLLSKEPTQRAPNAGVLGRELAAMEHGLSAMQDRPATRIEIDEGEGSSPSARTVSGPAQQYSPHQPTKASDSQAVAPKANAEDGSTMAYTTPADGPIEPRTPSSARGPFAIESPPAQATLVEKSRFITVEEERRKQEELERQTELGPAVAQIVVLGLMLVGIVAALWYFTRPYTADKLFARISAVAAENDPAALLSAEDDVREFLERFPQSEHAATVERYQEEIDLQRLETRFRLRARLLARDDRLSPAERDYMEAMNYLTLDPQKSMAMLEAMVELYRPTVDASESTAQVVELAKRQLKRLQEQASLAVPEYLDVINANLRRAEVARQTSPAEARRIWKSIVELYGDKRWAAAPVARARAALEASQGQDIGSAKSD